MDGASASEHPSIPPEKDNAGSINDFSSNSNLSGTLMVQNEGAEVMTDELKDTLKYMKYREALRLYYGTFVNYSFGYSITLATFVLLFVTSLTQILSQFGSSDHISNYNFLSDPNNIVLLCVYGVYVFSVISSWISCHSATFVRTTFLSKFSIAIYIISIPIIILYNVKINTNNHAKGINIFNLRSFALYKGFYFDTIFLFFFSLILFIINLIALFYRFVYRHLILYWINQDIDCYRITQKQNVSIVVPDVVGFRHVTSNLQNSSQNGSKGLSLTLQHVDKLPWYKEILPTLMFNIGRVAKTSETCRYVGQVDTFNRPHGFGFWKSTSFYGEVLVGFWENGKPLGPFKAREMGTGSGFSNILIGWAKCDLSPKSMKIGVASAECCVSGTFFRTFPRVITYEAATKQMGNVNRDTIHKILGIPESFQMDDDGQLIFGKLPIFQTSTGVVLTLSTVSNDLSKIKYSMNCNTSKNNGNKLKMFTKAFSRVFIPQRNCDSVKDNCQDTNGKEMNTQGNAFTSQKSINPIRYLRNKKMSRNTFEYKFSCITSIDAVLLSMCPHSPIFVPNTFNSITISSSTHGLAIHGHTPAESESSFGTNKKDFVTIRMGSDNELLIDDWVPSEMIGILEVWIFIHGFNTSSTDSVILMGQMSAFGNFPPYIRPLIFSWPSERSLFNFFRARENASSEIVHCHFASFIEALYENGIRKVHIMTHSMGARMFITSFSMIKHFFNKNNSVNNSKIDLLTITLISPEYDLDTFIFKDFIVLRKYCSHISIFSDLRDKALISCEKLTRGKALGRRVFEVYSTKDIENVSSDESSDESSNEYSSNSTEIENKVLQTKKTGFLNSHVETIADMRLPKQLGNKLIVNHKARRSFKHFNTMANFEVDLQGVDKKNWLDVDVIDTTWLGSNINNIRHTFWFLNREIIEDIRELIVGRKRACQRTGRLDRREGNVWVYRVAPQNVKSVFN